MTDIFVTAMSDALKTWQEVIETVAQKVDVKPIEKQEKNWFDELPKADESPLGGGWLDGLG